METTSTDELTVDLTGCARCDGDGHEELTFRPLTHPIDDPGGEFTHWAPCPTNGEPILMRKQEAEPHTVILYVPVARELLPRLLDGIDVAHVRAAPRDDGAHDLIFTSPPASSDAG